jgi:zinc D-Ala-D-Ala carboxypeptidase
MARAPSGHRMITAKPGQHFAWAELSVTGQPHPNEPGEAEQAALVALCAAVLDPLRLHLGKPVRVTSAYRSPKVNAAIGGASNSQHMRGEAADIKVEGLQPEDVARAILKSCSGFDQLIVERKGGGAWVHVSYALGRANRRQLLKITDAGASPWTP